MQESAAGTGLASDAKESELTTRDNEDNTFNFAKDIEGFDLDTVYKLDDDVMVGFNVKHDDYFIHDIKYKDKQVSIGYHKDTDAASTAANKKKVEWLIGHVQKLINAQQEIEIDTLFEFYRLSMTHPTTPRTSTTTAAIASDSSPSAATSSSANTPNATTAAIASDSSPSAEVGGTARNRSDSRESGEISPDGGEEMNTPNNNNNSNSNSSNNGNNNNNSNSNNVKVKPTSSEDILKIFADLPDWDMNDAIRHSMYFYESDERFVELMKECGDKKGREYTWQNLQRAKQNASEAIEVGDYMKYSRDIHTPVAKYLQESVDVKYLQLLMTKKFDNVVLHYNKILRTMNKMLVQDALNRYETGVFKETIDMNGLKEDRYLNQSLNEFVSKKVKYSPIREVLIRQFEKEKGRIRTGWIGYGSELFIVERDTNGMKLCEGMRIEDWVDQFFKDIQRMHDRVGDEICRYVFLYVFMSDSMHDEVG